MYVWPELFSGCGQEDATFNVLCHLLEEQPFCEDADIAQTRDWLRTRRHVEKDKKRWTPNVNSLFLVKSFYIFLNDGGLRCDLANFFWKSICPKKISVFNWLVLKNKILSLKNLELRRCNKLQTATCVMCHADVEMVDHLFLHCSFAQEVWGYFCRLLLFLEPPSSMRSIWLAWRSTVRPAFRISADLVVKALV